MTLTQIQNALAEIDSGIRHYFSMSDADAYAYWQETQRLSVTRSGTHEEGWRFYVHYFTKTEGDAHAAEFFEALDESFRIAVRWTVDRENDTGYIHHIFECEAI